MPIVSQMGLPLQIFSGIGTSHVLTKPLGCFNPPVWAVGFAAYTQRCEVLLSADFGEIGLREIDFSEIDAPYSQIR